MQAVRLLIAACGLALLGAAPPTARPVRPQRIVSLNMCADQFIVALADRDQIAGLTEWARDPAMSSVARQASTLPFTKRSGEEVMALRPDLVIGAPPRTRAVLAPLTAQGVPMVDLPAGDSVAAIEASIMTIAHAVGYPARGRRLIAQLRSDLARTGPPPGRGRTAAYYQRQGYLTGKGTLVDDMMRRVGLDNLAGRLGRPALSQLSIEEMALARPTFLIMESAARTDADRGTQALRHPVLNAAVPAERRLYIPQALIVCGGPAYPKAVAMLAQQVRAADRRSRDRP